ncbi:hypothetical protein V2J09_010125 [Rumex salicifolius]
MVVKMMKWPPWPPLVTRKYEVKVVIRRLEGFNLVRDGSDKENSGGRVADPPSIGGGLTVEIRWRGTKVASLMSSLRRTVKRNLTKEIVVADENDGVLAWEEEFQSVCNLSSYKDNNSFHPWEIGFTVLNGSKHGTKNKVNIIGAALLNLAEFASRSDEKEFELSIPLTLPGAVAETQPALCIMLRMLELRTTTQEFGDSVDRSIVSPITSSNASSEAPQPTLEKDELSALKAGLRKVKILTEYMSSRRVKKAFRDREEVSSEGKCSARSEDDDYPFESDSLDEFEAGETDEGNLGKGDSSSFRKSFSYGTLANANYVGGSFFSSMRVNSEDEGWVYYSNRKSDVGYSVKEDVVTETNCEPPLVFSSKRSILPWRKRKLSFRSPKVKGEPLLKKAYGEEGGDDIDFDRRQLTSDESFGWQRIDEDSAANRSSESEFGDDSFTVGSWEQKDITSRDGHMKLQTQVFFASIDQRSERAAGESACTALVAVIADWFHNNPEMMPVKCQFDSLIRDGSLEWRNMCEDEKYKERFPDKHFDLDTVLQAKIRSLSVHPGKTFIGFFHPDGVDETEGKFDFLHGAMSLDGIWDEITAEEPRQNANGSNEPNVYIISWNDHFFVLKIEPEAYYIIDTLGERLYEGCNQAYILKFDRDTKILKLPSTSSASEEIPGAMGDQVASSVAPESTEVQPQICKESCSALVPNGPAKTEEPTKHEGEEELVCQGKESCKEYIKSFLAAIPIRELQADIKKGLVSSVPLHQRLQIEFHYTELLQSSEQAIHSPPPQAMEADTKLLVEATGV